MQATRTVRVSSPSDALAEPAPAIRAPARFAYAATLPHFLLLCLQLTLVLLAIYGLRLEEHHPFFACMSLAFAGFIVHAWLPPRWRLPFFTLLSLGGVIVLLGWFNGLGVLLLGGLLLTICRLPVSLLVRVALLAAAAALLVVGRADSRDSLWPVLSSMFMFRLILYVFETREGPPPSLLHSLAYFFLFPNACFTLFPVVDFKTFRDTYYNDRPYTIYQSGISWIVRGLGHLLAYRAIKYYLLPAPYELYDLPHLVLFLAANYALYLRVSGWFHIITGTLHLFGFNLPRTHNNYFLAASFTDIWRRINTYWKEFLAKVFFFPIFFALRGKCPRLAMVVPGLAVFVATWLLHSYQTFWLRGELSLRLDEAALWLTAGMFTVVNVQWELRYPSRAQEQQRGTVAAALRRTLQVVGMFTLISLFWAWWTLPNFGSYLLVAVSPAATGILSGGLSLLAVFAAILTLGVLSQVLWHRYLSALLSSWRTSLFTSAALHSVVLLVLAAISFPEVGVWLGPRVENALAGLRLEVLTPLEAQQVARGYYEELAEGGPPARAWAVPAPQLPRQEPLLFQSITRVVDDWQGREPTPGWSGEIGGSKTTINGLGMRDRAELTQAKPRHTCRIACVGSSVVMGYGVADEETFTRLLHKSLNATPPTPSLHYEVLNFGTGNSLAIHRRVLIDRKVWSFEPDALYYFAHQDEICRTIQHLAQLVARGKKLPYPDLDAIIQQAGITSKTPLDQIEPRLNPLAHALLNGIYTNIVAECRSRGVVPVWIYLPMPGVNQPALPSMDVATLVQRTGFVVIDLSHWTDGFNPKELMFNSDFLDFHPNPLGHRLITERLDAQIRQRPELLPGQPLFHKSH